MGLQMQIHKLRDLFRGVSIGRDKGATRVASFMDFGQEIISTCFWLVDQQAIEVFLTYKSLSQVSDVVVEMLTEGLVALTIAQSGQIRPGNLVRVTGSAV